MQIICFTCKVNGRGLDWCAEVMAVIVSHVSRVMGEKRLNISDLARAAGISRSTATKLYHGGTDVNLSVVDRVCRALGADLCELFEYVPDGHGETREGARHRGRTETRRRRRLGACWSEWRSKLLLLRPDIGRRSSLWTEAC